MRLLWRPQRAEQRSLSFQDVWGAGGYINPSGGGDIVQNGLRLVPVYAATSLIADMVSTAPLRVFRESSDGTRTLLPNQPQLVINPSPYGSRIDWLHQAMASLLLRGNAYGYITSLDSQGRPAQIQWLSPDAMTVYEEQGDWFHTPTYYWRGRKLDNDLVVHIPAYTFPGSGIGLSPLAVFKLQITTGLQAQQFGSDWFTNGANPSGTLKNNTQVILDDQAAVVKARFKAAMQHRDVFVSGKDWDYTQIKITAEESQFLATIKANATQIAAIYRVSPEDVGGEVANSLTYKTLEQDATKLTQRTLAVWCARIETVLTDLLPRPQYARFDLNALSRGDMTSQMIAHTAALSAGLETNDEARQMLDRPPLTPEQIAEWQENYRHSAPALPGVPPTNTPAPKLGTSGGANA